MKIENHIFDILQLYEYAMTIGKSLHYKDSCDLFLKMILRRKNLNAAWIIERHEKEIKGMYSIPLVKKKYPKINNQISDFLEGIKTFKQFEINSLITSISSLNNKSGFVTIYNLNAQGYLFLYSKKDNLKHSQLVQLQPVIDKFSVSLEACKAFTQQQKLLVNLEERNQELSDYAHMVSHDLKSPLRSIDALTTWITEDYNDAFDANGKKTLSLIRNNVEKMDTLINGILEYSTIGKNRIEVYNVDLNNLIDSILNTIQIPNNISITKTNLPTVKGDKYRLKQLFQNLIENAVKYNNKGHGTIKIGAEEQENYWQFYIKDNGKGIEETYFDKIFKTFEKLDNNPESSGIGLSIVKKIVELYAGKIWLESQINIGSTFYFTLKKHPNGTT